MGLSNWKVPFEERCGGALIRTPYAIVRVDGIGRRIQMLVHNKGKFIRHIGDVRLIPGMNELSSSDIEAFTKGMEVPLNKALENRGN